MRSEPSEGSIVRVTTMTPTPQTRKCPKCGSEMASDKELGTYAEITLKTKYQFLGDRILTFHCLGCAT